MTLKAVDIFNSRHVITGWADDWPFPLKIKAAKTALCFNNILIMGG
jgi:hypothetical protein